MPNLDEVSYKDLKIAVLEYQLVELQVMNRLSVAKAKLDELLKKHEIPIDKNFKLDDETFSVTSDET